MANNNNNEKGKGLVRNQRFDDDGVYHPYRRPRRDIHEVSLSTSGTPPMAHTPRTLGMTLTPDSVPPRAHSSMSAQFSTPRQPMISPQDPVYSPASGSQHRGQVSSRAPPTVAPAAASTHRITFWIQKKNQVTSTVTSTDSDSDDEYGDPSSFPTEPFTIAHHTAATTFQRRNVLNDEPSTSNQSSGAPMTAEPIYIDDSSGDDEPSSTTNFA